jgi:hypothetical protein
MVLVNETCKVKVFFTLVINRETLHLTTYAHLGMGFMFLTVLPSNFLNQRTHLIASSVRYYTPRSSYDLLCLDLALGEPVAAPWSVKISSKVFVAAASSFFYLLEHISRNI